MIDICVNLLNGQFREDRDEVLERAWAAGVEGLLITATDLDSTAAAIALCDAPKSYCTAGVHPHDAANVPADWLERLRGLADDPTVRAIGETGLDFNRNYSPKAQQLAVFEAQIELAQSLDKPLFVHDRESGGQVLATLSAAGSLPPVVIHCFTGTSDELEGYLAADFYVGITGWVTETRRGADLRQLVARIPLDRLLVETDAPFLRPHNAPGDFHSSHGLSARYKRRNEPALLPYVLDTIAANRPETLAEITAATGDNAAALFGFS